MKSSTATQDAMTAINDLGRAYLSAMQTWVRSASELVNLGLASNPAFDALLAAVTRRSCSVPAPCWLPRSLGDVRSFVCPGGTASIRIRVTNCRPQAGTVTVAFANSGVDGKITPASATLGPMESAVFHAALSMQADACSGQKVETLVWVRGCNAHFLTWTVEAGEIASGSCHEIDVRDCPDYVHHWYDHFYCDRPCFESRDASRSAS